LKNNGNQSYGNCDEFLYLGGNEQSTHKFVSELLGKETIDTNTYGKSTGHSGNYSTNYQNTGRELLTPDEVRMLNNEDAILLIRGEKPIIDKKYDILKHPNIKFTVDGEGKVYEHGSTERAKASLLKLKDVSTEEIEDTKDIADLSIELLSEEDVEEYFLMEEYENEKRKENEQNS